MPEECDVGTFAWLGQSLLSPVGLHQRSGWSRCDFGPFDGGFRCSLKFIFRCMYVSVSCENTEP